MRRSAASTSIRIRIQQSKVQKSKNYIKTFVLQLIDQIEKFL